MWSLFSNLEFLGTFLLGILFSRSLLKLESLRGPDPGAGTGGPGIMEPLY